MIGEQFVLDFQYQDPRLLTQISEDLLVSGAKGVYLPDGLANRTMNRKGASFIDDPDGNQLFGSHYLQHASIQYPPVFISSWRDAMLSGFRTVVTNDGRWSSDTSFSSNADRDKHLRSKEANFGEDTPLCWHQDAASYSFDASNRTRHHLPGTTILLTSNEASNYGSFIFRAMPKLVTLANKFPAARFLVYASHKSFQDLLVLAGITRDRLVLHDVRAIYDCDHLVIPSNRNPSAFLDPQTRSFYSNLRDKVLIGEEAGKDLRLYVSRLTPGAKQKRRMVNESDLIETLAARGFTIFDPSSFDVETQIRSFASARCVVGPSGAGMFNAVFCRPGTKLIDIESEPHWIYAHVGLFASCDLNYGIFEGTAVDRDWSKHHKDWRLNVGELIDRIERFTGSGH